MAADSTPQAETRAEPNEEIHRLQTEADKHGMTLVKQEDWSAARLHSSLLQGMVTRFVSDGEGDVIGPSFAEPEVWARLHQLECGAAGEGVDAANLAADILQSLGLTIAEDGERYARLVVLIADWFKSPKEASRA